MKSGSIDRSSFFIGNHLLPERIPVSVSEFSMRFLSVCFCLPKERLNDTFNIIIRVKSLEKATCLLGAKRDTFSIP